MAQTYEIATPPRMNTLLWAGYALTLLAVLAYIFSEFFALPAVLIGVVFALGILLLVFGYQTKPVIEEEVIEKRGFRQREL